MSEDIIFRRRTTINNGILFELMESKGIKSFAELSRLSGISRDHVTRINKMYIGGLSEPLAKLAKYFNVTVDYLISDSMRSVARKFRGIQTVEEKYIDSVEVVGMLEAKNERATTYLPEHIEQEYDFKKLRVVVDCVLNERERRVIYARFGMDEDAKTFEDIARKEGVTRERIRQIEQKSLKKLRHRGVIHILEGMG
jgi:RNA polymerase sigma factor (sigma-70 family)